MAGKADPGPAPVAQDRGQLGDARQRVLSSVADAADRGVTVAEAAALLGGHPNRSRAHLEALLADGLVASAPCKPSGRGRPALRYRITAAGRRALAGRTGGDYRGLAHAFAAHLAATGNADEAREVGRLWAAELAEWAGDDEPPSDTGERLLRLLADLDFGPAPEADAIVLRTCPFVEEAREQPTVICGVHQGLIDGALESWGQPARAKLQPFSGPGACRLRLGA